MMLSGPSVSPFVRPPYAQGRTVRSGRGQVDIAAIDDVDPAIRIIAQPVDACGTSRGYHDTAAVHDADGTVGALRFPKNAVGGLRETDDREIAAVLDAEGTVAVFGSCTNASGIVRVLVTTNAPLFTTLRGLLPS